MSLGIAGLLLGVELVRFGVAGGEEFEQVGDSIVRGPRAGSTSQIIVKAAEGFTLKFDIASNSYKPVRVLPAKRTFTIKLEADTVEDAAQIQAVARDVMKRLPGVVSFEGTTPPVAEEPADKSSTP